MCLYAKTSFVRLGEVRFGWVRLGEVRFGYVRLG